MEKCLLLTKDKEKMMSYFKQKESTLKIFLSYFWPLTKKINTDYNGQLFLTIFKGRKTLNSKNANYSFGSLQQILEMGLSKVNFKNVNSALILGLGGGSVIFSLRKKYNYNKEIIAVELDQKMIDIAREEFSISSFKNLIINNIDAFHFVKTHKREFDLIIVDLFFDNRVPHQFYGEKFCQNLSKILSAKSYLIFNLGIREYDRKLRKKTIYYFQNREEYKVSQFEKVAGTNFLLIAEKKAMC